MVYACYKYTCIGVPRATEYSYFCCIAKIWWGFNLIDGCFVDFNPPVPKSILHLMSVIDWLLCQNLSIKFHAIFCYSYVYSTLEHYT